MATTVSYSASMRTRKTTSSSNFKSSSASQEYYENDYNLVGIVHFSGMSLANKVITGISLSVTAASAGYGAGRSKTVYVRKSQYQAASQSGVTGINYCGDALGTFSGSFYGNTTSYTIDGDLLNNLADYFSAGNNTICLYNPSPVESPYGYSMNYLQWSACTITVTYEEPSSEPTLSSTSINLGGEVTISTNRNSDAATHKLLYSFGAANGAIAEDVTDSCTWSPPLSLASELPSATSGLCTITCQTYIGGTLTGTSTGILTLNVPASVVPVISAFEFSEAVSGIAEQFGGFVRTQSKLAAKITAAGAYGSTIRSYRTALNGTVYTLSSFTTQSLNIAGENTFSVTVTDSRGRSAAASYSFDVLDYSPPSLTAFGAERCSSDGSAAQLDGTNVRFSVTASAVDVGGKNTMSCVLYCKTSSSAAWAQGMVMEPVDYAVDGTYLLEQEFDTLSSYDLKVVVQDFFYSVEQAVNIGTKQVMIDFYRDGSGIAFGKIAENSNMADFAWPLKLPEPLAVEYGGTGVRTTDEICSAIGALPLSGGTLTGGLILQGYLYPSIYLIPTYPSQTNRAVLESSYQGAASLSSWQDSTGTNRRLLEIRNATYASDLNWAIVLRDVVDDVYTSYRVFHSGMGTPVPIKNGGTEASTAKQALNNLGIFYADALPESGEDGQICLVPV